MNKEEILKIDNCTTSIETLLGLDKRAEDDIKNNTHNINQEEVITIIREFIRCKNDYEKLKKQTRLTGKRVKNKRSGNIGIILRKWENGSIAVLENISPRVINTHDSFDTLEIITDEVKHVKTKES